MKVIQIVIALLMLILPVSAHQLDIKHKLSLSGRIYEESAPLNYLCTFRYQPELSLTFRGSKIKPYPLFDLSIIYDVNYEYFTEEDNHEDDIVYDFYRAWFRYSEEYSDLRLGLQQINFGSASILRPLQWFDTIDPRDNDKQTAGVYALLYKKYFRNNANLWGWILTSEDNLKHDFFKDDFSDKLEFGGRIQYPFQYCTAAISYHHIQEDEDTEITQDKLGIDLRWDSFAGYWIESSLDFFDTPQGKYYGRNTTLGIDYTIPLGFGIYTVIEHLFYTREEDNFYDQEDKAGSTALMLSYPISMFDNIRAITNYNWLQEQWYHFISVSRSYDLLTIRINGYLNPEDPILESSLIKESGRSIELELECTF